jgi:hypothetical protein
LAILYLEEGTDMDARLQERIRVEAAKSGISEVMAWHVVMTREIQAGRIVPLSAEGFDPSQPRDEQGRWTDGGAHPVESEMRRMQKQSGLEQGAYIDKKTGKVLARKTGTKTGITPQVDMGPPPQADVVHVHTHPDSGGPSGEDVGMLGWKDVSEVRVLADGKSYRITRTKDAPGPRIIRETWDKHVDAVMQDSPHLSVDDTIDEATHRTARDFGFKVEKRHERD